MPHTSGVTDMTQNKIDLLRAATEISVRYIEQDRTARLSVGDSELAALDGFGTIDADNPIAPAAALAMIDHLGSPATMRQSSGRYFGFVNGGVTPIGLAASVIAGAWDQNAALPIMSPAATAIDAAAADLIVDVLALPHESVASFCGGATIANITGIVTGRDHVLQQAGWDVHTKGLAGSPPLAVVLSEEAHVSVLKTLRVAGIGSDAVHRVPADSFGRLDATQMPTLDGPALVILQAGNVNTGHSDPFRAIIESLTPQQRAQTWVHVDGAFGLWANATPNRRQHVDGVDLADSWATDAHKWLNAPYDCGVVVCRHPAALRHSMAMNAAYVETNDDTRSLMNLGLQMSQAARAVPVWAILASEGRVGVADAIERTCLAAERFAATLVDAGVELLTPVVLNQALMAFGDDATTDAVIAAVQADGTCWVGGTTWQGRRAMRISVSDIGTTFDDVDVAAAAILKSRS